MATTRHYGAFDIPRVSSLVVRGRWGLLFLGQVSTTILSPGNDTCSQYKNGNTETDEGGTGNVAIYLQ